MSLRVKIEYAVCEKLCVPAEGSAELTIPVRSKRAQADLIAAEAACQSGHGRASRPHRSASRKRRNLVAVDLAAPAGKPVELFVEGPTPEWALPIPKPAQGRRPAVRNSAFELDGLPPGVDPKGNFDLTFTVVTGERALEVKTHLD